MSPDMPLLMASQKMLRNEFTGLPVVDAKKKVVGIVTEYDLLTKGTAIHLPTFIKLFSDYPLSRTAESLMKGKLKDLLSFSVKDVMNTDPIVLKESATISEVVKIFGKHHRVNPIPIVNAVGVLVGIVSRYDIIKFYASMLERAEKTG